MSRQPITGAARVAGVVGNPVGHSLSPLIHNAWIGAADIDGVYIPLEAPVDGFDRLIEGLRGGSLVGLNVTLPFKAEAMQLADEADEPARAAGAANLILFRPDGRIEARNTDGAGLLAALDDQAPGWRGPGEPVAVLGAGGAARGAVAALLSSGLRDLRIVNRTRARAGALAGDFGPRCRAYGWGDLDAALDQAKLVLNATSAGLNGHDGLDLPWDRIREDAVVMDMVYRPLRTGMLVQAAQRGHRIVDGLAMLIGQARPSFEALFAVPPPEGLDIRKLALETLGEGE